MNFRINKIQHSLTLPSFASLVCCQLSLVSGLASVDSNSDFEYELVRVETSSPSTPNNVAGNADSTDPIWASNGSGIYYFSSATNFIPSEEDTIPDPDASENLYFWNTSTGDNHSISQDSHLESTGPITQIIEIPDSGDVFFSRLNSTTSAGSASTFFHYKNAERSTSVFDPALSNSLDYVVKLSGLGPDSTFPFASAFYSPESSPDLPPDINVPVYFNLTENMWLEAAPELFNNEFRSSILHGYNFDYSHFLIQVEAQDYEDFETENGNFSNLWFNDGNGGPGQAVELVPPNSTSPQLGVVINLDINASRNLAVAIVRNNSSEDPISLVQIDLGSMTTTPIHSELNSFFNVHKGIKINHTGSHAFAADIDLMNVNHITEFAWYDFPENAERLIDLDEIFPDSDWRLVGFWGQTQDLHLTNFDNQIARWNPSDPNPTVFPLSGADFVYSVSPDGAQVAIQTAEPLAPDLDHNNMQDIYLASLSDAEGNSDPTLISQGAASPPAGSKTKLHSSFLTQLETIQDPAVASMILGIPDKWSETSTSNKLTPIIVDPNASEAVVPITELINLPDGEKLERFSVSPGGNLIACVVESNELLPNALGFTQRIVLAQLLGEEFEIWEPGEDDFAQNVSFAMASFFQPSIDEVSGKVFLLARLSSSDVRLCILDMPNKEIQTFRIPSALNNSFYLLDYSTNPDGPIVTQGGQRIILPHISSYADRRPYALIFDTQDNEFYSLEDLDQDNVLGFSFRPLPINKTHFSSDGNFLGLFDRIASSNVLRVNLSGFPELIIEKLDNTPPLIQIESWNQIPDFRISDEGNNFFLIASSGITGFKGPMIYNWDQHYYTFAGLTDEEIESLLETTGIITRFQSARTDSSFRFVTLQYSIRDTESEAGVKHTFIKDLETGSVIHLDVPDRQIIGQPVLSTNGKLALIKTHHGSLAFPETDFFLVELSATIVDHEDFDQDGLPDTWENDHFGSLAEGPEADPDQDGLNNRMEWALGLDPLDSESALRLMIERNADLNEITLKWKTGNAGQFELETSSVDQTSGWNELNVPFTLYGDEARVLLIPVHNATSNLYRLKFSLD